MRSSKAPRAWRTEHYIPGRNLRRQARVMGCTAPSIHQTTPQGKKPEATGNLDQAQAQLWKVGIALAEMGPCAMSRW